MLWNLSVDEKLRNKIANSDLLPLLIKFLEDEEVRVKEAAGGVLANLALTASNHNNMIEAGVIPKLVRPVDSCTFLLRRYILILNIYECFRIAKILYPINQPSLNPPLARIGYTKFFEFMLLCSCPFCSSTKNRVSHFLNAS